MKQPPLMIFLMAFIGFIGLAMVSVDADARRLGGGRSMGRSAPAFKPNPPKAAPQQQRQAQPPAAPGAQRPSGASRWLGPLAGLAAGGLLASMFFGDGFEGFQFFDFLIIGLLIFAGVMLFKALRRRAAPAGSMGPAPAGAGPGHAVPRPQGGRPSFEVPEIGSGHGGGLGAVSPERPAWFNEEQFLRAAKNHFVGLQSAWDVGNLDEIREYTTPELFSALQADRQGHGGQQYTEVVSLDTELLGLVTEGDKVVASVRYSGMIREDRGGSAHPFSEIWHIERALDDSKANWYIAGIEQEDRGNPSLS